MPVFNADIHIFRQGNYWACNDNYYSDYGLRSSGWVYSDKLKLWVTKDDISVKKLESLIKTDEDKAILQANLIKRAERLERSYQIKPDVVIDPRLYDFQNVTPPEILERNILLADEMGLGKTVQAIQAINKIKPSNVLIIVPNMMVSKWYDEIDTWLSPECSDTQIYICPWSRITKMDLAVNWDFIIVDEAHYAKNTESQRSQAFQALKGKRKMALTGTPILGRPNEIYPIAHWLDPYVLGSQADFERRYMIRTTKVVRTRYGFRTVYDKPKGTNIQELQCRLRETIMISRFKKDVLPQLPPKQRSIISLDVSKEVKRLDAQLINLWRQAKESGKNLNQWANLVAIRKEAALMKLPYVNAFIDELFEEIFTEEMIGNTEFKKPIVVWAHHHEVIDGIKDHIKSTPLFSDAVVKVLDGRVNPTVRGGIVQEFQENKIDVLIAGITAAGVGITLTASDTAIFAEFDWTPANMVQAEDRLHRIGQERPINIYYCVAPNSLDSKIAEILAHKQDIIDDFNEDLLEGVI